MDFDDFKKLVSKKLLEDPFIFSYHENEQLPNDEGINATEKKINIKFTEDYKRFLKEYGGGDFCYTVVFTVNPESDFYIVNENNEAKSYLPQNFLAISDDGTGGMYGYIYEEDHNCKNEIYYWDHEENSLKKTYNNIFEFLAENALNYEI